jgi:hypothetical protein
MFASLSRGQFYFAGCKSLILLMLRPVAMHAAMRIDDITSETVTTFLCSTLGPPIPPRITKIQTLKFLVHPCPGLIAHRCPKMQE